MTGDSIGAYDVPSRVAKYDADMDVMHPNRAVMVDLAVKFLPLRDDAVFTGLDLGIGTGYFTKRLLEAYPGARVIGIDGAESMVELVRARLGPLTDRVDVRVGDFRSLDDLVGEDDDFATVFSSYSLHHLDRDEKLEVLRRCTELLRPGGWFLNADLIKPDSPSVEARIQQLRVEGIVSRADRGDERFIDETSTRLFIENLQAQEGDKPLTLRDELGVMREAGLDDVCVLWMEYRETVTVGRKPS